MVQNLNRLAHHQRPSAATGAAPQRQRSSRGGTVLTQRVLGSTAWYDLPVRLCERISRLRSPWETVSPPPPRPPAPTREEERSQSPARGVSGEGAEVTTALAPRCLRDAGADVDRSPTLDSRESCFPPLLPPPPPPTPLTLRPAFL